VLIKTQIAVIGYCFGGTGAIEAARGNLNVKRSSFFSWWFRKSGK